MVCQVTIAPQLRKSQRAYVIEFWTELAYHDRLLVERLVRLSREIATPRGAGDRASGMAAVKKGRMTRIKE
jgi:hypothetical protein